MAEYIDTSINPAYYIEVWEAEDTEHGKQLVMAVDDLKCLPPADVRPVVRGCWVFNEEDGHCYCSECGGVSPMDDQNGDECDCPNYCPNCGADLRGGDAE